MQAARGGALHVTANDIDPWAHAAIAINASENGCDAKVGGVLIAPPTEAGRKPCIDISTDNIVGRSRKELGDVDILIAGDVMYEELFAREVTNWLQDLSEQQVEIVVADPGRHFLDKTRLVELESYCLPLEIRDDNYGFKTSSVWTLRGRHCA
jgi:predicted nicotinamide N-methyase